MDIDEYLLDGERIKEQVHVEGDEIHKTDWDWYVTSERVIKHGSGFLSDEKFHDFSLGKVRGISFESSRQNALLVLGISAGLMTVLLRFSPSEILTEFPFLSIFQDDPITFVGLVSALVLIVAWYFSETTYLYIHGSDSPDVWKMEVGNSNSAVDSKEVRSFAMSLRKELSR